MEQLQEEAYWSSFKEMTVEYFPKKEDPNWFPVVIT